MTRQQDSVSERAYTELEQSIRVTLETYSNVHRGSGHYSIITTNLFERAREIVTEHLGFDKKKDTVIFCSARGEALLLADLSAKRYGVIKSIDIGLPLGIRAVAVRRNGLPGEVPLLSGGGTAKLISRSWVVSHKGAEKFEAGTPSILNIIAFARALQLTGKYGDDIFLKSKDVEVSGNFLYNENALPEYSGNDLLEKLRNSIIGLHTEVPTIEGFRPYINLDYSASTPAFKQAWEVARKILHQPVSGNHEFIMEVSSICSSFFNAPKEDYDVIFTSNTTEGISIAAESLRNYPGNDTEPVLLTTILEHSSNDLPWRAVPGLKIIRISIDNSGLIDHRALEDLLINYNEKHLSGKKRIVLVTMTGASNVLGIQNDIREISRITHKYGARILVDAAQMAAHRRIDMAKWGIDFLAFSSHKMYAPFGSGALIAGKDQLHFDPQHMELIRSSGEENLVGIAALGKSLLLLQQIGIDLIREEEQNLTGLALKELNRIPGVKIFGVQNTDSPEFKNKGGVIAFTMKNKWPHKLAPALAERGGIGTRFGCHCAHILVKHMVGVGPFLENLQRIMATVFPNLTFPGVARISIGLGTTRDDILYLAEILRKIASEPEVPAKGIKQRIDELVQDISMKVFNV